MPEISARHELLNPEAFQRVSVSRQDNQDQRDRAVLLELYENTDPVVPYDVSQTPSQFTWQINKLFQAVFELIRGNRNISEGKKNDYKEILSELYRRLLNLNGYDNYYQQPEQFYLDIKGLLEKVWLRMCEKEPLSQSSFFSGLMPQLQTCPTGLTTTLNETIYRLTSQKTLIEDFVEYRLNLLGFLTEQFIRKQQISHGRSIHAHSVFLQYANTVYFSVPVDESLGRHIDHFDNEGTLGFTEDEQKALVQELKFQYSPLTVLELTEQFFQRELLPFYETPQPYSQEVVGKIELIIKPLIDSGFIPGGLISLLDYDMESDTIKLKPEFFNDLPQLSRRFCFHQKFVKTYDEVNWKKPVTVRRIAELFRLYPEKRVDLFNHLNIQIGAGLFHPDQLFTEFLPRVFSEEAKKLVLSELWQVIGNDGFVQLLNLPNLEASKTKLAFNLLRQLLMAKQIGKAEFFELFDRMQAECGESLLEPHKSSTSRAGSGQVTTLLYQAVAENHPEIMEELIARGADVNTLSQVEKLLILAIKHGSIELVNLILTSNPAFPAYCFHREEFLTFAVKKGDPLIVERLVGYFSERGTQYHSLYRSSIIDVAIRRKNIAVLRVLLDFGRYTLTASHLVRAIEIEGEALVDLLLQRGCPMIQVNKSALFTIYPEEVFQPLVRAVVLKQISVVQKLLDKIIDKSVQPKLLHQAWLSAIGVGSIEIAQRLLPYLADPNIAESLDRTGSVTVIHQQCLEAEYFLMTGTSYTGFQLAYFTRNQAMKDWLLSIGVDPYAPNAEGESLAHLAIRTNFPNVLGALLIHSEVDTRRSNAGQNVLHYAVRLNREKMTDWLLASPLRSELLEVFDSQGDTPLLLAARFGRHILLRKLIQAGADSLVCNYQGFSALHLAARVGNTEVVKQLLSIGVGADLLKLPEEVTPLHLAAQEGHLDLVRFLVGEVEEAGVANLMAPTKEGVTALHLAAQNGHDDIFDFLQNKLLTLNEGWRINVKAEGDLAPIHLAAQYNRSNVVAAMLVNPGVNFSIQTESGWTPLHMAAHYEAYDVMLLLLSRVPATEIDLKNRDEQTPLNLCIKNRNNKMLDQLLRRGADINSQDSTRRTVLHRAIEGNDFKLVELLIEKGADLTKLTHSGETTLHLAVQHTNLTLIAKLLCRPEVKATLNQANQANETPIALARRLGWDTIADYLEASIELMIKIPANARQAQPEAQTGLFSSPRRKRVRETRDEENFDEVRRSPKRFASSPA